MRCECENIKISHNGLVDNPLPVSNMSLALVANTGGCDDKRPYLSKS